LAIVSGLVQLLISASASALAPPIWWRVMSVGSLLVVMFQCLLGGFMATSWSAQRCLNYGQACEFISWHRIAAMPVALFLLMFVLISFWVGGWPRSQWPFLLFVLGLVTIQVILGILTLGFGLSQPILTVSHQLVAALLVAVLAALTCRRPEAILAKEICTAEESSLEPCHG